MASARKMMAPKPKPLRARHGLIDRPPRHPATTNNAANLIRTRTQVISLIKELGLSQDGDEVVLRTLTTPSPKRLEVLLQVLAILDPNVETELVAALEGLPDRKLELARYEFLLNFCCTVGILYHDDADMEKLKGTSSPVDQLLFWKCALARAKEVRNFDPRKKFDQERFSNTVLLFGELMKAEVKPRVELRPEEEECHSIGSNAGLDDLKRSLMNKLRLMEEEDEDVVDAQVDEGDEENGFDADEADMAATRTRFLMADVKHAAEAFDVAYEGSLKRVASDVVASIPATPAPDPGPALAGVADSLKIGADLVADLDSLLDSAKALESTLSNRSDAVAKLVEENREKLWLADMPPSPVDSGIGADDPIISGFSPLF